MATKLFLRDSASDVTVGSGTKKGLLLQQGSAKVASDATATVNGPTAGVQVQKSAANLVWFSNPLQAVTISGNITFNLWGLESAIQANTGFDVLVERCDSSGNVISTILRSERGTELGTSASANNWSAAPTSTTLSLGDRIKVTVFGNDAGGTMASSRTFTLDYGAGTGVDGDSYVSFTETIAEGATMAQAAPSDAAASAQMSGTLTESAPSAAAASAQMNGTVTEAAPSAESASAQMSATVTEAAPSAEQVSVTTSESVSEAAPGDASAGVDAAAATSEAPPSAESIDTSTSIPASEASPGDAAVSIDADAGVVRESAPNDADISTGVEFQASDNAPSDASLDVSASIDAADAAPSTESIDTVAAHATGESAPGTEDVGVGATIATLDAAPAAATTSISASAAVSESAPGTESASVEELTTTVPIDVSEAAPAGESIAVTAEIQTEQAAPSAGSPDVFASVAAGESAPLDAAGGMINLTALPGETLSPGAGAGVLPVPPPAGVLVLPDAATLRVAKDNGTAIFSGADRLVVGREGGALKIQ